MKRDNQRRAERKAKWEAERAAAARAAEAEARARGVPVDRAALAPHNSYDEPDFVKRGRYLDKPFVCRSCGEPQIWTASQQQWWYEVAKGNAFTTASLCRPCRQRERTRRDEARRVALEGLARKRRDDG